MSKTKKSPTTTPISLVPEVKPITPPREKTMSEKIWDDIQYVRLDLFGLPAQTISKYCSPVPVEPTKLYLSYKVGAILPAMEMSLASKYDVNLLDKYLVISLKGKI